MGFDCNSPWLCWEEEDEATEGPCPEEMIVCVKCGPDSMTLCPEAVAVEVCWPVTVNGATEALILSLWDAEKEVRKTGVLYEETICC